MLNVSGSCSYCCFCSSSCGGCCIGCCSDFEIPEYTYEEFEAISVRIIKKLPQNTVVQIASSVWNTGSRDIRDVLKIAKLCNPADTEQDINRLISIHEKYRKTGKEYN